METQISVAISYNEVLTYYKKFGKPYLTELRSEKRTIQKHTASLLRELDRRNEYQHIFRNGVNSESLEKGLKLCSRNVGNYIKWNNLTARTRI